jgi:hypothetical protein
MQVLSVPAMRASAFFGLGQPYYKTPHFSPYNPYRADLTGLPWYGVRAYYAGGPWSGPGWSWAGWNDYARQNGAGCTPGTIVKGGDGINYVCQSICERRGGGSRAASFILEAEPCDHSCQVVYS